MSFVPKQLTIPAMPPVKKLEHKEKKMNRQRKVVITVTYNDLGTIVDTKAEELDSSTQPEIIRCKDCRFYKFKQGSLPWNHSRRYCNRSVSLSTQENDYCSYAELRGEQE